MDLFQKCKELYEKIRYFEYGIPVDGVIKGVPSAEYYVKNYHFLKPEEFEKYGGGICWDYVEYERKFLEVNDIDFNQYYIITNTPPNYDTHTFITVKDGDELIYIESSFKRVEHIIDGVQKFKTLEDIVRLITTNMWYCNDNDKRFDEFKYDVCKFKGHPQYGCTCEEYMKWMDDNSDIVIQDVTINPKKVNEDELTVESCNFFQEGLFNFGKPKEPVNVMAKLSETFGELSPAQKDIINRPTNDHNPTGTFDFFETPYSKYHYDMIIRARKLDSFLKKESVLIGSVVGVPEGSVPVGVIDIIPDIDNVIKNYEAYEDGQLEYDDYYEQYIDDPRYGLTKVRVYADQNGAIYTCLSQDGKYTQVAKSYDEFVSKFNTYKFKLNKNEFTVSRRYSSRTGIDVFSNGLNTGDAEFTTTYRIDSDDIHTVALLYARFISYGVTQIFNLDADGDDEPDDFPVEYESLKQIVTACAEHGIEHPFYPKMKVVELTFHKAPEPKASEPTVPYFVPSKLTYVFALNESLDKPFMTVEVESGKVMSVKFNDSTIKEYADPEEYDETLHDHIDDEDDVYNESWTDFKNGVHPSSGLMFHVSLKNDMDGKTINPQLPSYITDGGELDDNYQEDTKTKRLCVSPSIEGCLIAILNYNKIREHVGDKFYVYTPEKPFSQYKHKTNKEIVKDKLVFDANITKEAWILEPCKLKLYGIIKLKKVKDLKKKPTVEKNIKMNTIKLDYEWIMTPKASGKFNKVIGDSPDKEDDKKEKPIKEYDNILVSNDEFFMESQVARNKVLERLDYDPKTQTIDTGIKKKNGEPIRIKLEITNKDIRGDNVDGATLQRIDFEKAKEKLGRAPTLNESIYVSKLLVQRSTLNKHNGKPFFNIYHEIGHLLFWLNKHYPNEIDKSSLNNIKKIMNHVDKFDDEIKSTTLNNHDSNPEEYVADTYATSRTSKFANRAEHEEFYKHELQRLYGQHKECKKLLELARKRQIANSDKTTKVWQYIIDATENDIARLKSMLQQIHSQGDEGRISKEEMEKTAAEIEKDIESNTKTLEASKKFLKKDPSDMSGTFEQGFADTIERTQKESRNAMRLRTDIPNSFKESCIIMDNDEFFMETSKYERRRQREIESNLQKDVSERDSERSRESVNEKHRDKKEAKHLEDMAKSKPKKSSSNRNKIKILNILDYDPKTNTIKGNIKLPDGSIKKRIPYIIENKVMGQTGPALMTIDEFKQQIELLLSDEEETFFFDKPTLSGAERGTMEKVLKSLERFEAAGEKFIIAIPRAFLNKRHFTGLGASLHELGHLNYALDNSDSAEMDRAKKYRDDMKDKLTKDSPSWKHLAEDDPEVKKLTGFDSSNEFSADKYAADRVGVKNYERMLKNLSSFAKRTSRKPVEDMVKKTVENMDMYLKLDEYNDAFGESNRKFLKRVRKSILDTSNYISNSIQDADKSIIEHKQHVKEIDKKMAELNKQIKEYKSRSVALVSSCNNLVKEIDRLQKERDEHSEEIRNKRNERKDAQTRADTAINSGFSNMLKNLRKQIADYYKWLTDYDVELESRVNYVKKFYEKKNIGESCLIMDNNEFFMEANKNLVKSLKILDYDPKTKTIKCDIPRYDGKPNKRVIFLIDDYISQEKGDGSVGSVANKKELLEEYRSRTSNPEKLKAIDADIKYLNTRNDDEWAISIPRKILKTRNLQNLITVNHELGHIYCRETTSDDEWKEMQRWQRTRDEYNDIDRTVKNGDHAISTEELYADTYAADKVSAHALQKTDEKTFKKFKQDMYGYIKKAKVKQQKILNRLKSLPNELTEEEEFEIKKQLRELVIEIRKLHKPGLPDSQQDPKALAMFKEALKLEKKLDRSKDLPFEKNEIETELYHIGDALDLYASAIKNLNIEHLTHDAYANKKDRIKFESFSVLVSNDEFFTEASKNPAIKDLDSAESKDIYHNIDLWESGKCNLMWVTGLSGSGKSTIAKEIANVNKAEHIELDDLQRAKLSNWKSTGSKMLDDYIKSKGGLSKIFPYVNDMEKPSFRDLVLNEGCAEQFNDLIKYIISYAKSHGSHKYTVEGVQLAFYATDDNINAISQYPVVIKMTGPFKAEIRRIQRLIKNKTEFKEIFKQVSKRMSNMMKEGFYKSDYKKIKDFKSNIGESYVIDEMLDLGIISESEYNNLKDRIIND